MAFRIDPAAPLREEFARVADETGAAIEAHLEEAATDHASGLHEARKGIKKLRALARLVRAGAPEPLKAAETMLRDAGRAVSGPRDAAAAVEAVDRLARAFPKKTGECRLDDIRAALARRCEERAGAGLEEARLNALALCRAARDALRAVTFEAGLGDAEILARGMKKTLRRWERALEAAEKHGEPADFHELRKAVKAHAAQLGLLRDLLPDGIEERREATSALGERLGELNDIHVMRAGLAEGGLGLPDGLDARPFDRLLKRQGKALSGKALVEAGRLLAHRPGKLRRRLGKALAGGRA